MNTFVIDINPELLSWARETVGKSIDDAAKRLETSVDVVVRLESGQKKPTLNQLKTLSKLYKRPLAAFLLSEPPIEPGALKDFRMSRRDQKKPLTEETLLAIRRARRLQAVALELSENGKKHEKHLTVSITGNPESAAEKIRRQLSIGYETQKSWGNVNKAFANWRKAIETLGILVFQYTAPLDTRGFSIGHEVFPIIALNKKDSYAGRIFSIFHEYCHILLRIDGLCDMGFEGHASNQDEKTEIFCNHFAGSLLVPRGNLLEHEAVASHQSMEWDDNKLEGIARDFSVSKEVVLRRLLISGKASASFYAKKHKQWAEEEFIKKGFGKRNLPRECVEKVGEPMVSMILRAHRDGKITYSDVSDYLYVKTKHISKIESLVTT